MFGSGGLIQGWGFADPIKFQQLWLAYRVARQSHNRLIICNIVSTHLYQCTFTDQSQSRVHVASNPRMEGMRVEILKCCKKSSYMYRSYTQSYSKLTINSDSHIDQILQNGLHHAN